LGALGGDDIELGEQGTADGLLDIGIAVGYQYSAVGGHLVNLELVAPAMLGAVERSIRRLDQILQTVAGGLMATGSANTDRQMAGSGGVIVADFQRGYGLANALTDL